MKREEFIDNLNLTNAYELKDHGKVWLVRYDKIVYYPEGGGHAFEDWDELFAHKAETKTLGELVDELENYDTEFIYHIRLQCIDEDGNLVD